QRLHVGAYHLLHDRRYVVGLRDLLERGCGGRQRLRRQLQLEVAQPLVADRPAEADDGRLADPDLLCQRPDRQPDDRHGVVLERVRLACATSSWTAAICSPASSTSTPTAWSSAPGPDPAWSSRWRERWPSWTPRPPPTASPRSSSACASRTSSRRTGPWPGRS